MFHTPCVGVAGGALGDQPLLLTQLSSCLELKALFGVDSRLHKTHSVIGASSQCPPVCGIPSKQPSIERLLDTAFASLELLWNVLGQLSSTELGSV